jgi:hypothetical protein
MAKLTENLDAYDLYLRALAQYYTMTRPGAAAAIALLHEAIRIDANYALANANLAFLDSRSSLPLRAVPDDVKSRIVIMLDL